MECCGPGYASPADAIRAPREKILYTIAIYTGTGIQKPDYLCTIDADPDSPTYSEVIHRLEMPGIGDEFNSNIRVQWTPYICSMERCTNVNYLHDDKIPAKTRAATFDAPG